MAEIALCSLLDAVSAGAEIHPVEIKLETFGLGEFAFEPQRQHRFLQLAMNRALLRQKQIFRELLGDRRRALRNAAPHDVGDDSAADAGDVNAEVRIEAAILDSDESLGQV